MKSTKKIIEICIAIVEDNKIKVMQVKDLFQDTKLELWKIESNVVEVKREMGEVVMQKDAIHVQFK